MIDALLQRNLLPDPIVRVGIRRLLAQRLRDESAPSEQERQRRVDRFAADLNTLPIALHTEESKQQHYEVPTAFFQQVLGPRLKYSCGWFERGTEDLAEGEEAMLRLYVDRARLVDGQDILELGCGWGSLCLWLAARFPRSRITGVSHSRTQKSYIDGEARRRGLNNVTILTCDMNEFEAPERAFDRVVSIEMFEHLKNWPVVLGKVARWLKPGGMLFLHVFAHARLPYHFVARDESDWMSRHFFTGGMMPSVDLLPHFQEHLRLRETWVVNGRHYQRTAELWLRNFDRAAPELQPLLADTYGAGEARKWTAYWRVFLLSCAELWGYRGGTEWVVAHYLMQSRGR